MTINISTIRNSQPTVLLEKPLGKSSALPQVASQWFVAAALRQALVSLITETSISSESLEWSGSSSIYPSYTTETTLPSDLWGFGWDWYSITKDFPTVESLYAEILERRRQIHELKEYWRPYIGGIESFDKIHVGLADLCDERNLQGAYTFLSERLSPISDGISGSYFLSDRGGEMRYIVKPIDEDICCLNNRKGFASPYTDSWIRDNMTLYLSSLRETLAYETAKMIGVENVAPRTSLAILESDAFYDQLDGVAAPEKERYQKNVISQPEREKLCSVQEYVPNSKPMFEGLQDLQMAGLSDDEIAARIDTRDFEDANILIWCTYDTDAHMGNFLFYPKSYDGIGNEILGIKKIDNGLAFPEKNEQLRNNLRYLPNAEKSLTVEGRAKIAAIPIEALADRLEQFGLEDSSDALRERLILLKQIVLENPEITIKEIDKRMAGSHGIEDGGSSS